MGISALTPPSAEDIVETVLEFPDNRLLIDLCGEFDRNLAQIEHQMGVHILRRGNRLAVIGDKTAREQAAAVLRSLYARLESGRGVAAGDIDGAMRMGRPVLEAGGCRKRRADRAVLDRHGTADPQKADRTPDRGAEGLCRQPLPERAGLRHRPGGDGQDLSCGRRRGDDVHLGRGGEDHPVASGGGGGRTAWLPSRRHEGEGRSLHAAALRRAERLPAVETGGKADPGKADRDCAPGLHARPHAVERLRRAGRGAERHDHADEDVPDPPWRRQPDGRSPATGRRSTCRAARPRVWRMPNAS